MTASSADLRCLFIKKQTNKTNAYIKPATEIDQHPSYPKVNNHVNAPITAMTTDSSIDLAVFSSCTIVHFIKPHSVTLWLQRHQLRINRLKSLQAHTTNAYINQLSQTDQHPSHRNSSHRQNNPSEGKANCSYLKKRTVYHAQTRANFW